MDLILVPGLWLDGTVWDKTAAALRQAGHSVDALTLPGQGDGNTRVTYADQVTAVLAAVGIGYETQLMLGVRHLAPCGTADDAHSDLAHWARDAPPMVWVSEARLLVAAPQAASGSRTSAEVWPSTGR